MNAIVRRYMKNLKHNKPLTAAQFDRYTKDNQRRIISCDALRLLIAKKAIAANVYVSVGGDIFIHGHQQMSSYLGPRGARDNQCHVCALGSLLLGHIMVRNDCTVHAADNPSKDEIVNVLKYVFNEDDLVLIEAYYEGYYLEERVWDQEVVDHIRQFERDYLIGESNDRLTMILENIIEHGDFYPYEMAVPGGER